MSWLHQHSSGMQYMCSKHFQNRAGLIWSFSNLHCVPVKLQLTSRKFFKFRVPVQCRVHRSPNLHGLCRRHLQANRGLRSMHSLCCRQVFCVDWADERDYMHSLCCRQVFCVDWADERDHMHSLCCWHVLGIHSADERGYMHQLPRWQVLRCRGRHHLLRPVLSGLLLPELHDQHHDDVVHG